MKLSVVTTFNQDGYEKYAQRMIKTFLENWPVEVTLYVYAEECVVKETAPNLVVRDLCYSSPELMTFKNKWRNVDKANGDISSDPTKTRRPDSKKSFKWDAIRFSHKVYAIFDCAKKSEDEWLIWMDADTVCHSPIELQQIIDLIPHDKDLCYLGREAKYSECGLYAMNLKSAQTIKFLEKFQWMYDNAEQGIFKLVEWHDSFVFDAVRKMFNLAEHDWSKGIIRGEGHPLINSAWGAYIDHLKGDRKSIGRSKQQDLKVRRTEEYWTNVQS